MNIHERLYIYLIIIFKFINFVFRNRFKCMKYSKYGILNQSALIFLFGILLLLAPCRVRNFVESVADLEKTEVSNKSKARFSEEIERLNCNWESDYSGFVIQNDIMPESDRKNNSKSTFSHISTVKYVLPGNFKNETYKITLPSVDFPALYLLFQKLKLGATQ